MFIRVFLLVDNEIRSCSMALLIRNRIFVQESLNIMIPGAFESRQLIS